MLKTISTISILGQWVMKYFIFIVTIMPAFAQDSDEGRQIVNTQGDSLQIIQEGFSGGAGDDIDYDALAEELYGEEKKQIQAPKINNLPEQPLESSVVRGLMKNSSLHGAHLSVNGSSPFAVAEPLRSWYSYIDASISVKLPYEVVVESLPVYILFEVSSFSFENSYPVGGSFAGISYVMQASTLGEHAGAAIGFGLWDGNLGSMLELNYRFYPLRNTFFRMGTRGIMITDIDPLGPTWWLELRLSMGLEL